LYWSTAATIPAVASMVPVFVTPPLGLIVIRRRLIGVDRPRVHQRHLVIANRSRAGKLSRSFVRMSVPTAAENIVLRIVRERDRTARPA